MDIEIIEMDDRKMRFILKKSSPAMANALRRTLLSDIPKMAIDKVEFFTGKIGDEDGKEYESITPLFEEIIAHRLGMIPIPTDLELFVPQSECVCGGTGCPSCQILYRLSKTGPATVLSSDLEPLTNNDKLKVVDGFIPVVELTKDQGISAFATAVMGTARKHVKWQVANGVGYKYRPIIKIDSGMASDDEVIVAASACPKKVFSIEGSKVKVVDSDLCDLCMACVENSDSKGISVEGNDTEFYFKFETDGSLTAKQTLDVALKILAKEANDFANEIEAL